MTKRYWNIIWVYATYKQLKSNSVKLNLIIRQVRDPEKIQKNEKKRMRRAERKSRVGIFRPIMCFLLATIILAPSSTS